AKAHLAHRGRAGAGMGAQAIGQAARRAGGAKQHCQTLEMISHTAMGSTSGAPCWMFLAACRSRGSLKGESSFGNRQPRSQPWRCELRGKSAFFLIAITSPAHFCDRHHITNSMTELASRLSIGTAYAVLTFDVPPKH